MPMKKDLKLDQYDISPYAYRELHNFCLQYPEKKRRLRELESPFGPLSGGGGDRGHALALPAHAQGPAAGRKKLQRHPEAVLLSAGQGKADRVKGAIGNRTG